MAKSIHTVFWVGAGISFLALLVTLWLPKTLDNIQTKTDRENTAFSEDKTLVSSNEPLTDS